MNNKEIKSLIANGKFRAALIELDKINHSFSKSTVILKWEDIRDKAEENHTMLTTEQCEEMTKDLYGSDGKSGVMKELMIHINSIK